MSSACTVIKRDGNKELFSSDKIRKVIIEVSKGLKVNPIELEANIKMNLHDSISSKKIMHTLIITALNLTSIDEPDWKYVAGRLKLLSLYKDIWQNRAFFEYKDCSTTTMYAPKCYLDFVNKAIELGIYSKELTEKYSSHELYQAGEFLDHNYDFEYDYAGMNLLIKRYICEYKDIPFELPQEMFLTLALLIEQDSTRDIRLEKVKEIYHMLAQRKISLATPLLMNLRRPNSNLSSCFIAAIDDSRESIFYVIDQISAISKHGGGVGVNISRVRSKGSRIKNIRNASGGVIPWIRIINDTAVAVNQQGKRKGAVTVSLDVWHLDIQDFLELQTENGDQRMKAYDIFPQIVIPDAFMRAVENEQEWLLCDPNEIRLKYNVELSELWGEEFDKVYNKIVHDAKSGNIELFKFVQAKALFKKAMQSQIETGMPYIAFKDTLNRYNPNKHDGTILGTNLCTESHSNIRPTKISKHYLNENNTIVQEAENGLVHVCNLLSINLANISDETELQQACYNAVRILDNAIDFTNVPVLEGKLHNMRYRTIGVGAMGLADWLAKRNITYSQSASIVDELFEKFAIYNIQASIELAKERGTFQAFEGSDWDKGIILGHDQTWFEKNSENKQQWKQLFENLKQYGIRNSQITAIAPNTSSALIQGCSASVLPVYSKFYIETHGKGSIPNCPPFIKDKFWYYQENKNLEQKIVVDVVSNISKWIDTGVSLELIYNLNNGIKAIDIYQTIMEAWKKNLKTLYYTRSIQQDGSLMRQDECFSCAS